MLAFYAVKAFAGVRLNQATVSTRSLTLKQPGGQETKRKSNMLWLLICLWVVSVTKLQSLEQLKVCLFVSLLIRFTDKDCQVVQDLCEGVPWKREQIKRGEKEGTEGKKREEKINKNRKKKKERNKEKTVTTNQTRTCQTRNDDP